MHSSYRMQAVALTLIVGLVLCTALPADYFLNAYTSSIEKKSPPNLNEFMSAMKGAPRLRYGKRSSNLDYEADEFSIYPLSKRMSQNLPELIDSLNGAERLRFGK